MDKSDRFHFTVFFTAVCVLAGTQIILSQQNGQFTTDDLPDAVKMSFEKSYPHAVIKGAGKELENEETMFEIESMDGNVRRDILFKNDGTIYEVETTIPSSDLLGSVQSSINNEFPGFTIVRAEMTVHAADSSYEVLLKKGDRKYEVVLNLYGKIIEKKYIRPEKKIEDERTDEEGND